MKRTTIGVLALLIVACGPIKDEPQPNAWATTAGILASSTALNDNNAEVSVFEGEVTFKVQFIPERNVEPNTTWFDIHRLGGHPPIDCNADVSRVGNTFNIKPSVCFVQHYGRPLDIVDPSDLVEILQEMPKFEYFQRENDGTRHVFEFSSVGMQEAVSQISK